MSRLCNHWRELCSSDVLNRAFSYMSSSAGSFLILTGTAEKKHKGESQDQAKDHCRYKYITSLLFHLNVNQFKVPEY